MSTDFYDRYLITFKYHAIAIGLMESTLTLKFKGIEADLLDKMVSLGLFNTKSEAIRSALIKYAIDLKLLEKKDIWAKIEKYPRREITPEQLVKNLELLENEN